MLEKLNENEAAYVEDAVDYWLEDFGIQEGDMD